MKTTWTMRLAAVVFAGLLVGSAAVAAPPQSQQSGQQTTQQQNPDQTQQQNPQPPQQQPRPQSAERFLEPAGRCTGPGASRSIE